MVTWYPYACFRVLNSTVTTLIERQLLYFLHRLQTPLDRFRLNLDICLVKMDRIQYSWPTTS